MRKQFIADDNTIYETEEEALARDEAIKQANTIQEWMESAEITGKKVKEYNRVIIAYLAFVARA